MSYPPTNGAGYDLRLLYPASDPVVGNPHSRDPTISAVAPLSSGPPQPQLHTTGVEKLTDSSTVGYSPGVLSYAHKGESKGYEPVVAVVPWYRTRRGITVIVVAIAIVVFGVVVGGVVGSTHHGSKSQSDTSGQQSTGNTTQQGQQSNGVGPTLTSSSSSSGGFASNAGPTTTTTTTSSTTSISTPPTRGV